MVSLLSSRGVRLWAKLTSAAKESVYRLVGLLSLAENTVLVSLVLINLI
jgi:hypothetical protein